MASSSSAAQSVSNSFSCHDLPAEERRKAVIAFSSIQKFMRKALADVHPHVEVTFKMNYRFAAAPPCRCEVCDRELVGDLVHKGAEDTLCFICGELVDNVGGHYPELAAENFTSKEARYAAIARQNAETCAEAADDTDDEKERMQCLQERAQMMKRAQQFEAILTAAEAKSLCQIHCSTLHGFHHGVCRVPQAEAAPSPPAPAVMEQAAPSPAAKRPDYNHHHWPSPRAKMFANELTDGPKIKKHEDALAYLASRAGLTVEQLLEMSPRAYADDHNSKRMPTSLHRYWYIKW